MRNGHYLGTARRFLEAAKRELTQGKIMQDDTALRQAAEKGWGAALQATKGLLFRHGVKPPRGTQRTLDVMQSLEQRVPAVRAAKMYHQGTYNLARIERQLRDLAPYITNAGRL